MPLHRQQPRHGQPDTTRGTRDDGNPLALIRHALSSTLNYVTSRAGSGPRLEDGSKDPRDRPTAPFGPGPSRPTIGVRSAIERRFPSSYAQQVARGRRRQRRTDSTAEGLTVKDTQ
ncbi:hypothetical protein Slala03_81800 [Streptomyces lavendulae subsp. lavendulae]|nr:hypothetical protein Slala03_81800 [Streptomyces lavendulae subsp. lavendulae]